MRSVLPVAALVAGACTLVASPPAWADRGVISPEEVAVQCAYQYPDNSAFTAGAPYLVPPNDAYSWRCQRFSKAPDGGVITGLGVDLGDFCARDGYAANIVNVRDAGSWQCV